MQGAVDKLKGVLKTYASIVVSYARGASTIHGISATKGRTPYTIDDGAVILTHESSDYLIDKADLAGWTPASGDVITEPDGRQYEVAMPKPLNVYESIGPDGSLFKIHTKAVS